MNTNQQKLELINWITSIKNERLLNLVTDLKKQSEKTPTEILEILDKSAKSPSKKKHTSARDLII